MRASLRFAALLMFVHAATTAADPESTAPVATPATLSASLGEPYVVHEWGTFTSFSGSDGVRLEFRPLVEQDLPEFVCNPARLFGWDLFSKRVYRARQRMETPVIYFYTDQLRDVNVKVAFPQGLLTEFYPPPRRLEPEPIPARTNRELLPAEQLRGGLLDWGKITLIPQSALRPNIDRPALAAAVAARALEALPIGSDPEPELFTGDHYYFARQTDASLVHVGLAPTGKFGALYGDFFERFLFYRGLGNFELPVTVTARTQQPFQIHNRGPQPLQGLMLVQVLDDEIRFSLLDDVAPGETMTAAAPAPYTGEPPVETALWTAVRQTLLTQGLYEREADAMLNTWQASWFREPGTRLLYIVPREVTDELLPLTLDPQPRELVRVLVGRLDILPSDEEQRLEQLVAASAAARALALEEIKRLEAEGAAPTQLPAPPGVPAEIQALGRLAEPALSRISYITQQDAVRYEAAVLMQQLRASDAGGE